MRTDLDDKYWRRVFAGSALNAFIAFSKKLPEESKPIDVAAEALAYANDLLQLINKHEEYLSEKESSSQL